MNKMLSVYMKYGEKADTCSIFATVCRCCCIVLLFYVHGKHLRSCRDGQLT